MVYPNLILFSVVTLLLLILPSATSGDVETKDLLKKLTYRLDSIQKKNLENDVKIGFLENDFTAKMGRLEAKVGHLETINAEQDKEIAMLKSKMNSKQDIHPPVSGSLTKPTAPSSCKDLATNGHSFQGLYLIKNPDTSLIQIVLCQFGTSVSQEMIDGSTTAINPPATLPLIPAPPPAQKPVEKRLVKLFEVERYSIKGSFRQIVTYDRTSYNDGTMNMDQGTFTAPAQGVYLFEARALPGVNLQLNGNPFNWVDKSPSWNDKDINLKARVALNAGDRVSLYNSLDVDPVSNFVNWSVHIKGFREE